MANYSNSGNHTFRLSDYYNYYGYEIESISNWQNTIDLKALNTAFLVASILICVFDLLLLVTAFSAPTREQHASWYMYHLNFVTILQISFSLPRLEADLHSEFGVCMFFSFAEWVFNIIYYVNLALMDIEILTTILTQISKWNWDPKRRFYISMTAAWISCILFSVLVKFFGHEEHPHMPLCFHENSASELTGRIVRDWIPAVVVIGLTIAGSVIFIRTKRSPQNYSNIATNPNSLQLYNEWFAVFLTYNGFVILTEVLLYEMYINFFYFGLLADIILQMAAFLVHIALPLTCLFLEPVRKTCLGRLKAGFLFVTGIKRSDSLSATDTQTLDVETSELM